MLINGHIVIENVDKKEFIIFPLESIKLTDAELQKVLEGSSTIQITAYKTEDTYQATRFKKA